MLSFSAQKRSRISPAPTLRPDSANPSFRLVLEINTNLSCRHFVIYEIVIQYFKGYE